MAKKKKKAKKRAAPQVTWWTPVEVCVVAVVLVKSLGLDPATALEVARLLVS